MMVRVRISVPGSGLSLADARVALVSWLYARHENGALVLCVEDAAPPGPAPGSPCDDLRWLGLDWDEGPYLQSERTAGYAASAAQLLGAAAAVMPSDRPRAGDLPPRQGLVRLPASPGEPYTVRDLVQGTHTVAARPRAAPAALAPGVPPDPILAAVTDDHALGITHVFRSQERWPELATYLHLCGVLGWPPPHFAHLPVLPLDGPSARPASLYACREEGYLPLAVANDLARMGWAPRGRRELLPLNELAARFDLSRVARGPVRPALGQLEWLNRRCLAQPEPAARTELIAARWRQAYGLADRAAGTGLAPGAWREMLADAVAGEVHALVEVPALVRFAFVDEIELGQQAAEVLARPYAAQVLAAFAEGLSAVGPYVYDELDAMISALRLHFREVLGVRSRDVLHVVRAALTGRVDGPCLVVACQLLGRARCLERAQAAQQNPLCTTEQP